MHVPAHGPARTAPEVGRVSSCTMTVEVVKTSRFYDCCPINRKWSPSCSVTSTFKSQHESAVTTHDTHDTAVTFKRCRAACPVAVLARCHRVPRMPRGRRPRGITFKFNALRLFDALVPPASTHYHHGPPPVHVLDMPRHCTGVVTGVAAAHGWPGWPCSARVPEVQLVSDGSLQRRRTHTALQEGR